MSAPGWLPGSCPVALCALALVSCTCDSNGAAGGKIEGADAAVQTPPTWIRPPQAPAGPKGMVWIDPGALVAGTAPEQIPRRADQEMPGEQVILEGFFMDAFAYPGEEGAIPLTNVTHAEAQGLCDKQGKRLCTELEWERACKGPKNLTYEYGQRYQATICRTGEPSRTLPSGLHFSCRSDFSVHDMHGGIWEWTDSPWGRGTKDSRVAIRGGNGADGELIGRCANAEPHAPDTPSRTLGFRCCSGPRNADVVNLSVVTGQALRLINIPEAKLLRSLEQKLPKEVAQDMKKRGLFRMNRLWEWRPLANEDLLIVGGCAGVPPLRECGVLVVRRTLGRVDVLDWVSSGQFIPTLKMNAEARQVWMFGGDTRTHFKREIRFEWGKVAVGSLLRNTDD
jgi:formylglycine-generating enzyme